MSGRTGHPRRYAGKLLTLETSDPATGAAFERCRRRLLETAHAAPATEESVLPALAALSIGDRRPAEALLTTWATERSGEDSRAASGVSDPQLSLMPLLAARHLGWTGDARLAARIWSRVRDAHARAQAAGTDSRGSAEAILQALMLRESVPLAEAVGDAAAASEMTRAARSLLQELRSSDVSNGSDALYLAAALCGLDRGTRARAGPPKDPELTAMSVTDRCLRSWAAMALGEQEGVDMWHALIRGDCDKTFSDPNFGDFDESGRRGDVAALVVAGMVFGLVGATPDAPKMRLRLRPFLPAYWSKLIVRNLAMGDAQFDLTVERSGGRRICRVEQSAGAIPATLILEVPVPNSSVRAIEVDGRPAALDIRPFGGGFLIPVQLVLDECRTVVMEGEGY